MPLVIGLGVMLVCAPISIGAQAARDSSAGHAATTDSTARSTAAKDSTGRGLAAKDTITEWGAVSPGEGFTLAKTDRGELGISAYAMFRYLNQLPPTQSYVDHLGRTRAIDTRNDLQFHRAMIFVKGWMYDPKLRYTVTAWTVNATGQVAIVGNVMWVFGKQVQLVAGINGMPGTRSLGGSHPFWLAPDRVMADEYMRPGFTSGVWASGEALPRLFYNAMIGTNISQLGISAGEDTRHMAYGGSLWWVPTTGEFGPRGGFGDFEHHEKLATRIGTSWTYSRENRYSDINAGPEATQIKISDALNLFELGALADSVTVKEANYKLNSFDIGLKYRGFFIQTELYHRVLSKFDADGPIPIDQIVDDGYYVQAAYMAIPKVLEAYASTSRVNGEFNPSWEVLGGVNWFPTKTRNHRVNAQLLYVDRSSVSSNFGYYIGGIRGPVVSLATSVFF
jgi:hypothetical protein